MITSYSVSSIPARNVTCANPMATAKLTWMKFLSDLAPLNNEISLMACQVEFFGTLENTLPSATKQMQNPVWTIRLKNHGSQTETVYYDTN